jgi:predicted unusual protein kinase regulating ubiquinone biosynthesis (AarF/ABC1/UbiB family)
MHAINQTINKRLTSSLDSGKKLGKILKFTASLQYMSTVKKASSAQLGEFTRNNLTSLGTTFIKIGQLLSTRSDILDKDFTSQLASLQDNVPPFDIDPYLEYINTIVAEFDKKPIASASIGQVHRGVLKNGEVVAIKLKRPRIEAEIYTDFQMLLGFIAVLRSFSDRRELFELETVFKQYEILLSEEINFKREVQNIQKFNGMFKTGETALWTKIPKVYEELSTNDVIVMEYVPAIKINDFQTIDNMRFDRGKIAEKLVESYIIQIVEHGMVHIDPHPGNVAITRNGKIVFYDYGMVTELSDVLMSKFQDLLLAVSEKDADAIARIMVDAGIVSVEPERFPYLRSFVLSFLEYIETVNVESFQENFINKISTGDLPFIISSNFLLLLRGITILEGVCKQLDPNFNYKKVIDPYINSFPIDINYLEKRALKDIESLQNFAYPKMMTDVQRNDIDKQLMEIRLRELSDERDKSQTKQNVSNVIVAILLLGVGMGGTFVENPFIQVGIASLTFMTLYNKKK